MLLLVRFVFDAMIDPDESRSILVRMELLLRVHYFLCGWKQWVRVCQGQDPSFCIQDEALDSLQTNCHSLLGLMLFCRVHGLSVKVWELSSQRCEALFRLLRCMGGGFSTMTTLMAKSIEEKLRWIHTIREHIDDQTLLRSDRLSAAVECSDFGRTAFKCDFDDASLAACVKSAFDWARDKLLWFGISERDVNVALQQNDDVSRMTTVLASHMPTDGMEAYDQRWKPDDIENSEEEKDDARSRDLGEIVDTDTGTEALSLKWIEREY